MKEIYVGRQPILNARQKTVAYELLYRCGGQNVCPSEIDGTSASLQLISNVFSELGLKEISGGLPVFINFNREMLLSDIPDLNASSVVIEILEDMVVDRAVVEACRRLRKQGFMLALDDFVLNSGTSRLLKFSSIIKIDWRADPLEHIQKICQVLKPFKQKLLAEKIETEHEFSQARDLGFHFFQGFFFARPAVLKNRGVKVLSGSLMEIMGLLQDDDTDFETIEKVVSRDAALSFKLLKIINSASIAVSRKIDSIGQALVLLGQQELKRWLTLLLLTQVNDRCPFELLSTAFIRGLFSEKIANAAGRSKDASSVYFIGLLSLLDSILRCPMEQAVKGLPLSDQLKAALINESGSLGIYIVLVKAYERAEKDKIKKMAAVLGIEVDQVVKCYIESLKESGAYMQGIAPDVSAVS